jgi:hypothetical protein
VPLPLLAPAPEVKRAAGTTGTPSLSIGTPKRGRTVGTSWALVMRSVGFVIAARLA